MKIPQNTYCVFTLSIVARQIIFSFPAYLYNLNNKTNSLNNALMSSFLFMDSIVYYIKLLRIHMSNSVAANINFFIYTYTHRSAALYYGLAII